MIRYIDEFQLTEKTILLRVDFNVPINENGTISDDTRIKQVLPTIIKLLEENNRLILTSHLGKPEGRDPKLSLAPVIPILQALLPGRSISFITDFVETTPQISTEIAVLENLRFYPGEKANDPEFAKKLAALGEAYVNDAFSVCHRKDASIVGVPRLLPSYGGLLLKKEIATLDGVIKEPEHPFIAALGGSKISTKLPLLQKLVTIADKLLLGGGLANSFLEAEGLQIGQSIAENDQIEAAKQLLQTHGDIFLLPIDVVVGNKDNLAAEPVVKKTDELLPTDTILDIGPQTQVAFADVIGDAKTIIWNGPVGYFEDKKYRQGTDSVFTAIISNPQITSVIGGGDTLAAIHGKNGIEHISHISTAGGAMLTYIADGTLPGIQALDTTT